MSKQVKGLLALIVVAVIAAAVYFFVLKKEDGGEMAAASGKIGNCEVTGEKGSMPFTPAVAGQLTVEVSLPAPIWWNGDTPETIADGFEYCMAANIAWRAGLEKVVVVNVGWDALVTGQTRDFDLALSQISITDERKKVVDFSRPYFSSDIGLLALKGATVTQENYRTLRIGVQQGTTGSYFATDVLKLTNVSQYPEQGAMFAALAAGQIDVAMTDTSIVLAQETVTNGEQVVVAQIKSGDEYGALYPKGGANNATIDGIITALIDDGTISALADKYLAAVWGKDPAKVPYFNP